MVLRRLFDAEKSPTRLPRYPGGIRQTHGRPRFHPVHPGRISTILVTAARDRRAARWHARLLTSPHRVRREKTDGSLSDHHYASLTKQGDSCLHSSVTFSSASINGPRTIRAAAAPTRDRKNSTPISRAKRNGLISKDSCARTRPAA